MAGQPMSSDSKKWPKEGITPEIGGETNITKHLLLKSNQ